MTVSTVCEKNGANTEKGWIKTLEVKMDWKTLRFEKMRKRLKRNARKNTGNSGNRLKAGNGIGGRVKWREQIMEKDKRLK